VPARPRPPRQWTSTSKPPRKIERNPSPAAPQSRSKRSSGIDPSTMGRWNHDIWRRKTSSPSRSTFMHASSSAVTSVTTAAAPQSRIALRSRPTSRFQAPLAPCGSNFPGHKVSPTRPSLEPPDTAAIRRGCETDVFMRKILTMPFPIRAKSSSIGSGIARYARTSAGAAGPRRKAHYHRRRVRRAGGRGSRAAIAAGARRAAGSGAAAPIAAHATGTTGQERQVRVPSRCGTGHPAGAVPSIIAVMMRGDTKASRASGQAPGAPNATLISKSAEPAPQRSTPRSTCGPISPSRRRSGRSSSPASSYDRYRECPWRRD
jgi:hypothetical protein